MSEITKKADGPLTEERVHVLRKQMKGRRYSMDEWIADAENDYEKWAFTKLYEDLTSLNLLAESDIDDKETV